MNVEERNQFMRPYHALYAAIIQQAIQDVKGCGSVRFEAAHFLMGSTVCSDFLTVLGIDASWFRAELRKKSWFARACPEGRLFNPVLAA